MSSRNFNPLAVSLIINQRKKMRPSDAMKLAINALKDVAHSRQLPSGTALDQPVVNLYIDAAESLAQTLQNLLDQENGRSQWNTNWT
ncbi:hypothetical protein [Burkholderia ubonensis]|uniref:hypothetical protein n=1 Tax=Burkholderia ubonensis TaxID=101571 RepID=UPI0012FB5B67|nr:hypothetical protein [Burkholderia ubonensis]